MIVSLLLRSADRADGIFAAMQNRGFTEIPARTGRIRIAELAAAAFGEIGEILADTRLLLDCGLPKPPAATIRWLTPPKLKHILKYKHKKTAHTDGFKIGCRDWI